MIAGAATAGLQDERTEDPAHFDEPKQNERQRARATAAERNGRRKQGSGTRPDVATPEKAAPRQGDVVVASYDYEQMSDTDMSMHEGERFVIEGWRESGETKDWALVRRLHNSAPGSSAPSATIRGYVPYAYLEKATAPHPPSSQQDATQDAPSAVDHTESTLARGATDGDDIFARFDKDHDGALSTEEFRKVHRLFKGGEV